MSIERLLFTESSPNLGGQELQILQQLDELRSCGIEVSLACRAGSAIEARARDQACNTIRVPFTNSLHWPSLFLLRQFIGDWRPDAIISHSGHDANNTVLATRLLSHRPVLIRMRTYLAGHARAWHSNMLADRTLVCSHALRQQMLANPRIDPQRVGVLYPGLALAKFANEAELPLPSGVAAWLERHRGPLLVHAAMLRPEKGHRLMLSALPELLKKHPTLRYLIAGDGELRSELAASIQAMDLGAHVFLAGLVSPLPALYRRADLVVMPSTYEPLGMSQCEALSLAVPVVASHTGGIPETVQHKQTGLLVEPGNRLAWIAALNWALDNRAEMQRMAAHGRQYVRQNFSVERNVSTLLAEIEALRRRPEQAA